MKVYEFIYTNCIHESAMETMSVHRTKKGAYKAMRDFLETEYNGWREEGIMYGKQHFKFGCHEYWAIRETELKD